MFDKEMTDESRKGLSLHRRFRHVSRKAVD